MVVNEKQFINGFNSGYLLAKHEPKMLNMLLQDITSTISYINGIKLGQIEYEKQNIKERLDELNMLNKGGRGKDIE